MSGGKTKSVNPSGSPHSGEPEYLVVGSLRRPHGLRGELVMELHTDFPERLHPGVQVYLGEAHQPARITGTRGHNEGMLIKFDHTDTPEDAARNTNQLVYVTRADRPPLPPGQYYYHELIGFEVVYENDVSFGRVSEILETGANAVYLLA